MKVWLVTVAGAGVVGSVLLARYDAWALVLAAVLAALVAVGATTAPRRG